MSGLNMSEWSKHIIAGGIFENFNVDRAIIILMISYIIFIVLVAAVHNYLLKEKSGKKIAVIMSLLRIAVHVSVVVVLVLLHQIMFVYS